MDLHILSSIISRGFALGFSKIYRTNEDVFLIYKLKISPGGTTSQQSSLRTKYTIEPPLRTICSPRTVSTRLDSFLWSPRTKYTLCSTHESLLTILSSLVISLFNTWGFYSHGHDSDTMLELRLSKMVWYCPLNFSWFCFGLSQEVSYPWRCIPYL